MIPRVVREYAELPVALLDEPLIAMREQIEGPEFDELVEDIREKGIQIALIVERRDDRYRIAAGHRRYRAALRLGATTVPCDIREPGVLDEEAIKVLENDVREKVNPAEAAYYLARLYVEKCHEDVDAVCALVKRPRGYVETRLLLLQGDPDVLTAVKFKRIGLGVALELNQIAHAGYRQMHLARAINEGMTRDQAHKVRLESNGATAPPPSSANGSTDASEIQPAPAEARNVCTVCLGSDHPERMRWITVHEHCQLAVLEKMLAPWRAAQAENVNA